MSVKVDPELAWEGGAVIVWIALVLSGTWNEITGGVYCGMMFGCGLPPPPHLQRTRVIGEPDCADVLPGGVGREHVEYILEPPRVGF